MWDIALVAYFKALPRHFAGRTQDGSSKFELGTSRLQSRRVNCYFTGLYELKLTICRFMEVFQYEQTW
jgi:hypothetical protein